jgi:5-methylcytosine-specific restriction endonuclease McrA
MPRYIPGVPYKNPKDRRRRYRQRRRGDPEWVARYRAYQRKYQKLWRRKDLEGRRKYERQWARTHRRKIRGEDFGKRRHKKTDEEIHKTKLANRSRHYARNRERIRARVKEKRLLNPEQFRKVDRARYRRNPEKRQHQSRVQRAKRTGLDCYISLQEWKTLLTRFNFHCAYCGVVLTKGNRSLDHKIPLVRGGTNDISNLVPSCLRCNQRKNKLTAEEFQRISVFQ